MIWLDVVCMIGYLSLDFLRVPITLLFKIYSNYTILTKGRVRLLYVILCRKSLRAFTGGGQGRTKTLCGMFYQRRWSFFFKKNIKDMTSGQFYEKMLKQTIYHGTDNYRLFCELNNKNVNSFRQMSST